MTLRRNFSGSWALAACAEVASVASHVLRRAWPTVHSVQPGPQSRETSCVFAPSLLLVPGAWHGKQPTTKPTTRLNGERKKSTEGVGGCCSIECGTAACTAMGAFSTEPQSQSWDLAVHFILRPRLRRPKPRSLHCSLQPLGRSMLSDAPRWQKDGHRDLKQTGNPHRREERRRGEGGRRVTCPRHRCSLLAFVVWHGKHPMAQPCQMEAPTSPESKYGI